MRLPVVLSSGAATGIPAQDGRDFLVSDDDAALAEIVVRLSGDAPLAASLGANARRFVVDQMSWAATLAPLPALLGRDPAGVRHAA